jgi:hypothetical protein
MFIHAVGGLVNWIIFADNIKRCPEKNPAANLKR